MTKLTARSNDTTETLLYVRASFTRRLRDFSEFRRRSCGSSLYDYANIRGRPNSWTTGRRSRTIFKQ